MKIDVCLTPDLAHQFDLSHRVVVVIDILRATSCIVAGLGSGIASITPVETIEQCEALGIKGYITAGERGGQKLPQFRLGNSPLHYTDPALKGRKVALTTTNGTRAIERSKAAPEVIIGAFLNLTSVVRHLLEQKRDILLFCAGWKGRYNMEDSLFAGAVCDRLEKKATLESDASASVRHLYRSAADDLYGLISKSNHALRLARFGIQSDIEFCTRIDAFDVLPFLHGEVLVAGKEGR